MKNVFRLLKKNKITLFVVVALFFFSVFLRIWNLNGMGQVWDEVGHLTESYQTIEYIKHGDFHEDLWWKNADHPPLSKYVRGLVSYLDIEKYSANGTPIFRYDLTYDRMVSVILVSLAVVFTFLITRRFLSLHVGIIAALILSMLPILLGHSRIGLLEPFLILSYTAATYSFILFLEKTTKTRCLVAGIVLGFAMLSKETNVVLLPPFFILASYLYKRYKKRNLYNKQFIIQLVSIFALAGLTFFLLWPIPFFHIKEYLAFTYDLRFKVHTPIPEVFFGHLELVRPWYYIVYFFITTPLIILMFFLFGFYKIIKTKNWFLSLLILWFLFPFVQSFYHNRQQGIRYIIEIYVPMAIIAAYGFDVFVNKFVKQTGKKLLLFIPIVIYLLIIIVRISPYYLDYFNGLVGGAKGVYEKKLFHLAWWGQGEREAGLWLEHNASSGSHVGLAIGPTFVLPQTPHLSYELYQSRKKYDYVVVSFYEVVRIGFDDAPVKKNYKVVYSVMADGAHLIDIYQRKK